MLFYTWHFFAFFADDKIQYIPWESEPAPNAPFAFFLFLAIFIPFINVSFALRPAFTMVSKRIQIRSDQVRLSLVTLKGAIG